MRQALERLLEQGRDNALLRFGLGNACLQEGDAASAALHLEKATEHDPLYSAAWKQLGRAWLEQEMPAQAKAAWTQGLEAARARKDGQSEKEMQVFLRRLERQAAQDATDGPPASEAS